MGNNPLEIIIERNMSEEFSSNSTQSGREGETTNR
jgi:hypothetical protein